MPNIKLIVYAGLFYDVTEVHYWEMSFQHMGKCYNRFKADYVLWGEVHHNQVPIHAQNERVFNEDTLVGCSWGMSWLSIKKLFLVLCCAKLRLLIWDLASFLW